MFEDSTEDACVNRAERVPAPAAERTAAFQRNDQLEGLLAELSERYGPQEDPPAGPGQPAYPVAFIVGAPRGGTTLLLQWLAASGRFSYPTNVLSRFYYALELGVAMQKLLFEERYAFRDELAAPEDAHEYRSQLGKTRGPLAPHVFWYFWRYHFPFGRTCQLTSEQLCASRTTRFLSQLAVLEQSRAAPVALKAMIMNWNLPYLDRFVPQALFLNVRRNADDLMASIYFAREAFAGSADGWWSFEPPEYETLKCGDRYQQIAGFVRSIERATDAARTVIAPERWLDVAYEEFCAAPGALHGELTRRYAAAGYALGPYRGPACFPAPERRVLPVEEQRRLRAAYEASG